MNYYFISIGFKKNYLFPIFIVENLKNLSKKLFVLILYY